MSRMIQRCLTGINLTRTISSGIDFVPLYAFKRYKWSSVIGLEIHAQVTSSSKLFSSSPTDFASPVNNNVNLFDAAIPGTLPVLNKKCVESAVLIAKILSCQINSESHFDRKHYFYSDLPAGYQITQQRSPIAKNGKLDFYVFAPGIHKEPYLKRSQLKQIQLEQDSGKSLHDDVCNRSLIDLNRAGIPLIEFVFEPDLTDGEEAAALVKELTQILRRSNVCSCKMEEGALRVDANVSVHKSGYELGVRTEIKNIGTIRGVANAIKFEIERQISILEEGGNIVNETRTWDAISKITVSMRDKEEKQDYRYMPEPNLPPLRLKLEKFDFHNDPNVLDVSHVSKLVPKLPMEDRNELMEKYGLSKIHAFTIVNVDELLSYFHELVDQNEERSPRTTVNFLLNEFLTIMYKHEMDLSVCPLKISEIGEIIDLLQDNQITKTIGSRVLEEKITGNPLSISEIVSVNNWQLISDPEEIEKLCKEVMEKYPKFVRQYRGGKTKIFSKLMRHADEMSENKANLKMVVKTLTRLLDSKES